MTGSKIFFSYTREDSDFALQLATDIRKAGADIWMDQLDIRAGSRWDVEVEKALQSAESLLVILTPESVSSHNVSDEISYAFDEKKTVIPVLLKECKIPFRLRRLQYADFIKEYEKGFAELLKALNLSPIPVHKIEKEKQEQKQEQPVLQASATMIKPKKKREQILQQKSIVPDKKEPKPAGRAVDSKPAGYKEKEIESENILFQFDGIDFSYDRVKNLAKLHGELFVTNHSIRFKNANQEIKIKNIASIVYMPKSGNVYDNYMKVSYYKENRLSVIYFMRFAFFAEKPTLAMYNQIQELINHKKLILVKK